MTIDVSESGTHFEVQVTDGGRNRSYRVTVDDAYHKRLASGSESKREFIRRSFEFLLERESMESILSRFDLSVISRYFPEYESTIKE